MNQQHMFENIWVPIRLGSMGMVYLPTFTIEIHQLCVYHSWMVRVLWDSHPTLDKESL